MNCTICGLPKGNIVGSVLPQCKCEWQAPIPPQAQREWQGLTDEEIKDALVSVDAETKRLPPGFRNFAKAIEAKLKEKNG